MDNFADGVCRKFNFFVPEFLLPSKVRTSLSKRISKGLFDL